MVEVGKPGTAHDDETLGPSGRGGPARPVLQPSDLDPGARRLFDLLPDAVVLVDARGVIRYANRAGVALAGAGTEAEVVGQPVWTFVPPEEETAAREREQRLRRGEEVPAVEQRLVRLDGRAVPVELVSTPVRYADHPGVLITLRDLSGRKVIEQELAESRDLFFKAFRLGPAASTISSLEDGRYVDVNDQYVELTGYSREELIGRSSLEMGIWPDQEARHAFREQARRYGALHNIEYVIQRKDGELRNVISSVQRIDVRGEDCVLAITVDVTARQAALEAERESRMLFRRVFHASPIGIGLSELESGRFIDVNDALCEILGYKREELLGRSVGEIGAWDEDARDGLIRRLKVERTIHDIEMAFTTRGGQTSFLQGSFSHVDFNGVACVLGVVRDVSERRRAEESEREYRALRDKIFYASPAGVSITRVSDGRILEVNDAWCQLSGYGRGEAQGKTMDDLHLWEGRGPRVIPQAGTPGALPDQEVRLRQRGGETRTLLASVQQIYVESEACLLSVLIDITERKQTEQKLREAKEHAEEMAQLKSTFLTNLTHEIRTPLTVILGFTSILRQGVRAEYARFVQLIERSGRRLLLMLDSLLDLAQLEAGTLRIEQRPYNLADVIQSAMQTLRTLAEDKGLAFVFEAPAERLYARLDHAVLTRVLNNVLDNALKFTEKGSISVALEAREEWAYIHILDTGIGIDTQFLPQIFVPFSQESTGLERTHQGSGLGLAVSKRLIELMGGRIEVKSQKGQGSVFTIILPRDL